MLKILKLDLSLLKLALQLLILLHLLSFNLCQLKLGSLELCYLLLQKLLLVNDFPLLSYKEQFFLVVILLGHEHGLHEGVEGLLALIVKLLDQVNCAFAFDLGHFLWHLSFFQLS